jgi:serine phosphatase RsbU (regulator of sigma subunit)
VDEEFTQIVTLARDAQFAQDDRLHCLEFTDGIEIGRRHVIGPTGVRIGRTPPSDVILTDSQVSRSHCTVIPRDGQLIVNDLNSTNGTFVDGARLTAPTVLPVGSILQVGSRMFKHEWRTRSEIAQSEEMERELRRAASYVQAMLPPPVREGAIRADWFYQPSARLGGDGFGYGTLRDDLTYCYLIDVAGHGTGAAMHGVAVMNQLRQRTLPNTDMADPAAVLTTLNQLFQMDGHDGLYFTIWYGVYRPSLRRIDYASAGHHAAYIVPADRSESIPLRTKNGIIGALPGMVYKADIAEVPLGASLYLFSDGVFEIVTKDGQEWGIQDFLPLLLNEPVDGLTESQRLFREISEISRPGGLDDDFSLVVATFD